MLTGPLWDVYQMFHPRPSYCSDGRIDYVFFRGDYEPVEYQACLNAEPSDHPFVIIGLGPKRAAAPRVKTHAPVTAISPAMDELLVTGIADEGIENGRLCYAHWAPGSDWQGWHRLDSHWTPDPAHGLPESFVESTMEAGAPHLFWIGPEKWVMHAWRLPDGYWFWWPVGTSDQPAFNGVPGGAVHAVSCQPGMLHVFYTSPEGRVLGARRDTAAATWPEHRVVLGGSTLPGGHVTAASRHAGQLDIFTVGLEGRVYTAAWNLQRGWQGWWAIGDVLARPGTHVSAVCRSTDHLDLFVADADGRVMSAAWEPGFGWRGWWHIQGGSTSPGGYVTAVSRSADKLDLFTTRPDWRIYTAAWDPVNNWQGWWPITNAQAQSPVWPVSRSPDKLDLFFVNPGGTVQTAAWEPGRIWVGPWTLNEGWAL